MGDAPRRPEARKVSKLFSCFTHQVRHGFGHWEGSGPYVVRAEDDLLQIRPGPDMPLLSLRPRLVQGSAGVECFIHCHEGPNGTSPGDALVAVYRYGINAKVYRHPAGDGASLGILSDSYVAVGIARALVGEAHRRSSRKPRRRLSASTLDFGSTPGGRQP
jgi:hypothetical protein